MAKDVAISKKIKISEAQQRMVIYVGVASVILGVALSLSINFIKRISFDAKVIAEKEAAVKNYSDVIASVGVCVKPSGDVYNTDELKKCNPDNIKVSQIPGTLRANILEKLAANEALNSVAKDDDTSCVNSETGKNYTYKELNKIYDSASNEEELSAASDLIKSCSALRIIPDALPSYKNEEALLASLNKIFNISGWTPESLSPSSASTAPTKAGLNSINVSLSLETDAKTTMNVLNNIERSIREFNVYRASIEWEGDDSLSFSAQASAYYIDTSSLTETTKTIKVNGGKKK